MTLQELAMHSGTQLQTRIKSSIPTGDSIEQGEVCGIERFFAKAKGLFVSCDNMVGGQFGQSLVNLNSVVVAADVNRR